MSHVFMIKKNSFYGKISFSVHPFWRWPGTTLQQRHSWRGNSQNDTSPLNVLCTSTAELTFENFHDTLSSHPSRWRPGTLVTEMFKKHFAAKRTLQNDCRIDFWDLFFVKQCDHIPPDDDPALYMNNGIFGAELLNRHFAARRTLQNYLQDWLLRLISRTFEICFAWHTFITCLQMTIRHSTLTTVRCCPFSRVCATFRHATPATPRGMQRVFSRKLAFAAPTNCGSVWCLKRHRRPVWAFRRYSFAAVCLCSLFCKCVPAKGLCKGAAQRQVYLRKAFRRCTCERPFAGTPLQREPLPKRAAGTFRRYTFAKAFRRYSFAAVWFCSLFAKVYLRKAFAKVPPKGRCTCERLFAGVPAKGLSQVHLCKESHPQREPPAGVPAKDRLRISFYTGGGGLPQAYLRKAFRRYTFAAVFLIVCFIGFFYAALVVGLFHRFLSSLPRCSFAAVGLVRLFAGTSLQPSVSEETNESVYIYIYIHICIHIIYICMYLRSLKRRTRYSHVCLWRDEREPSVSEETNETSSLRRYSFAAVCFCSLLCRSKETVISCFIGFFYTSLAVGLFLRSLLYVCFMRLAVWTLPCNSNFCDFIGECTCAIFPFQAEILKRVLATRLRV